MHGYHVPVAITIWRRLIIRISGSAIWNFLSPFWNLEFIGGTSNEKFVHPWLIWYSQTDHFPIVWENREHEDMETTKNMASTGHFFKYMSINLTQYEQNPKAIFQHQSNHGVRRDEEYGYNKIPWLLYWQLHTSEYPCSRYLNFSYSPGGTTKQALFSTSTLPWTIKKLHVRALTLEFAYVSIGPLAGSQYAYGRTCDSENRSKICAAFRGCNANSEQAPK
jgi:hypothetical protein